MSALAAIHSSDVVMLVVVLPRTLPGSGKLRTRDGDHATRGHCLQGLSRRDAAQEDYVDGLVWLPCLRQALSKCSGHWQRPGQDLSQLRFTYSKSARRADLPQ